MRHCDLTMFLHCELLILILVLINDGQGGWKKSKPNSRPYMVLLERRLENGHRAHCGGFLLNADFVMTAAHCRGWSYTVFLGLNHSPRERNSNDIQLIYVEATFPHGGFNATNNKNDIRLLKLSSKAKISNNVRPILLAGQRYNSLPKSCSIFRWERKDKNSSYMSDTLMEVNVKLVDSEQCAEGFYCSQRVSGQVQGDCGAPLVCDGKAYGVVTNFHSGATEIQMYAKIPGHRSWIDSTMKTALESRRKAFPNSRPYMVLLERHLQNSKPHCGGFLLNEDFVMTAAHCKGRSYSVFLGLHNSPRESKSNEVQNISVDATFTHEDYDAENNKNDIMLLKLSSKAKFNKNVRPILLADQSDDPLPKSCSIWRWERQDRNSYMYDTLIEVNVTLVDSEQCAKDNFYCSEQGMGPGEGDCGAPLVCEDGKAYGVVSTFHSDAKEIQMYAKIPGHRSWIDSTMRKALKSTIFFCLAH